MSTLRDKINNLSTAIFHMDNISIRPISCDEDLWYAVVECELTQEQIDLVNPAGFSIGRAFLNPEDNIPCIIRKNNTNIGYIVLRKWFDGSANSWSYYLDRNWQGYGYGRTAALIAINILKSADPEVMIKLSTESTNSKAHRLYSSIGFQQTGEMDGDDLVFQYIEVTNK